MADMRFGTQQEKIRWRGVGALAWPLGLGGGRASRAVRAYRRF